MSSQSEGDASRRRPAAAAPPPPPSSPPAAAALTFRSLPAPPPSRAHLASRCCCLRSPAPSFAPSSSSPPTLLAGERAFESSTSAAAEATVPTAKARAAAAKNFCPPISSSGASNSSAPTQSTSRKAAEPLGDSARDHESLGEDFPSIFAVAAGAVVAFVAAAAAAVVVVARSISGAWHAPKNNVESESAPEEGEKSRYKAGSPTPRQTVLESCFRKREGERQFFCFFFPSIKRAAVGEESFPRRLSKSKSSRVSSLSLFFTCTNPTADLSSSRTHSEGGDKEEDGERGGGGGRTRLLEFFVFCF